MLSLTTADFQQALPFSVRIEDGKVQPFVADALTLDLVPLLGWPVLEAVGALPAVPAADLLPYVPGTTYTAGQYVVRQERVYRATADTTTPPPAQGTAAGPAWAYQPVLTLWTQFLRRYWLQAVWARMAPQHGIDLTKSGIVKPQDPQGSFVAVSGSDRAEVVAAADSTAAALRNRLTAFLAAETVTWRADNATGYDYGQAHAGCGGTPARRSGLLRGINNSSTRYGLR